MIERLKRYSRRLWLSLTPLIDFLILIILGGFFYWAITMVSDDKTTLIIGLSGLLLSMVTAYVTILRPVLRKARLTYEINTQWSESPDPNAPGSLFFRLKIENHGLSGVHNCVGRLVGVWSSNGEQLTKFDALSLYWSRQSVINLDGKDITTFKPIDIQGCEDYDFLDIAQQVNNELRLRIVLPPPMTLNRCSGTSASPGSEPVLKIPGTYYLKIGVFSESAFIAPFLLKCVCSESRKSDGSPTLSCKMERARRIPKD